MVYINVDAMCSGLSVTGAPIRLERYCEQRFRDATDPIVIFIGAVAKSNPSAYRTVC